MPNGYDPDNDSTRYDVLYLMHGGGDDQRTWFGTSARPAAAARVLDHMTDADMIAPVIVVAPPSMLTRGRATTTSPTSSTR